MMILTCSAPESSSRQQQQQIADNSVISEAMPKTMTKTMTNTMTKTMTKTFRTHLHRAILETFYLWDIWSEWCGNMTWPKKRQQQRQWQWRIHLENTNKEGSFKTFREHPQMPILKKFWVWPFIHCYEFRPLRTKLMGVGQILHVRPNITSSAFHNFSKISQSWNTWNTWNTWS